MLKTPSSTVIGGAFWTPSAVMLGGDQSFDQIMKRIFANGEQGDYYDPNDLSTMFQDALGTIPVTSVGQPVGLMLGKSKGLTGFTVTPLMRNGTTFPFDNFTSGNGFFSGSTQTAKIGGAVSTQGINVVAGRYYKVKFNVVSATRAVTARLATDQTGAGVGRSDIVSFNAIGEQVVHLLATSTGVAYLQFNNGGNVISAYSIKDISLQEISGNHAYQPASSMRPLLQDTPRRIQYDGVDDKLTTTFASQLTGCTVIRAVPNVGTQILNDQAIPALYNDTASHCGLIIINRALTSDETSAIAAEFNKRAGV